MALLKPREPAAFLNRARSGPNCAMCHVSTAKDAAAGMAKHIEELGFCDTPIGEISLRRRYETRIAADVLEIKLGDEFLMSSLIADSEMALANLALDASPGDGLHVAVGGLGLGYTARAVLDEPRVAALLVIDYLQAVISWHETGLLPLGPGLTSDPRCAFTQGDFFALAASETGLDPAAPNRSFDVILVDIDHSPDALLDNRSASFYTTEGFTRLARHLKPGGIFGLWSDAAPDQAVTARLQSAFATAWAKPVPLNIPGRETPFTQTIYLARKADVASRPPLIPPPLIPPPSICPSP